MAVRIPYDTTLPFAKNGTSHAADDTFTTGRYNTVTIQHAVSSIAQSLTYHKGRSLMGFYSALLVYASTHEKVNIKRVELVGTQYFYDCKVPGYSRKD